MSTISDNTNNHLDTEAKYLIQNHADQLINTAALSVPVTQIVDAVAELAKYPAASAPARINIVFNIDAPDSISAEPNKKTYIIPSEHVAILSTEFTKIIKQSMNNPERMTCPSRRGKMKVTNLKKSDELQISYINANAEYLLTIKGNITRAVENGEKMFNLFLEKSNAQHGATETRFLLSELVELGIYADMESAYRGAKYVAGALTTRFIEATVWKGKKEEGYRKTAIVYDPKITFNECSVVLPEIIRNAAPQYMILPKWGYSMKGKLAYRLLDYIYYLARQNTGKLEKQGYFTISLDTIRAYLGLPTPETVKEKHKSNYNLHIIQPLEKAVETIEDAQQAQGAEDLMLELVYNYAYKNIHEYLEGYIQVSLNGATLDYMKRLEKEAKAARAAQKRLEEKKEIAKSAAIAKANAKEKTKI